MNHDRRALIIITLLLVLIGLFGVKFVLPKVNTERFSRGEASFDPGQFLILHGSIEETAAGQLNFVASDSQAQTNYTVISTTELETYLADHPEKRASVTVVASRHFEAPDQPLFILWIDGQTLVRSLGAIPFLQGSSVPVTEKKLSEKEQQCLATAVSAERLTEIKGNPATEMTEAEITILLRCFPRSLIRG